MLILFLNIAKTKELLEDLPLNPLPDVWPLDPIHLEFSGKSLKWLKNRLRLINNTLIFDPYISDTIRIKNVSIVGQF